MNILNKPELIFFTQLSGSIYSYVSITIQLHSNHLFIQLKDQTILFLTIHFNVNPLFARSLNVKKFYLTYR